MIYSIQVNVYAIALLIVVYISMRLNKDINKDNHRYFYVLLYLISAILFVDMIAENVNGVSGWVAGIAHHSSVFLLFALSGFAIAFWYLYVFDFLPSGNRLRPFNLFFLFIPACIVLILSTLSPSLNLFYTIDENNIYYRGSLYFLYVSVLFAYTMAVFCLILKHLKNIDTRDQLPLLSIPVFPLIRGMVQAFFPGVLLIWPLSAFSLFIVFVFIQSKLVSLDPLTQLYNRREFERRLTSVARRRRFEGVMACAIFDIDGLKRINDMFGHHLGDVAIQALGGAFMTVCKKRKGSFAARIGGDEFALMIPVANERDFDWVLDALRANIDDFNRLNPYDFDITFSIGKGLYDAEEHGSVKAFFVRLDKLMMTKKPRT